MKQIHDYKVEDETWDEQRDAGRYNPAKVITLHYRRRPYRFTIGAGSSDQVSVWREGERVYILAINDRLGYCGIENFELGPGPEEVMCGEGVFLQADYEIEETLGRRGLDLAPATIVRRLSNAIDY